VTRKVAVVTGASRGIGRQLAADLARNGYDVACVARSSLAQPSKLPGTVEETADLVRKAGREALAVSLDVRDEEAIAAFAQRLLETWGHCDVLVNNAAVAPPRRALDDTTRRWRLAVDVNLNGPFYFIYYLGRRMAERGSGHVLDLSSIAAAFPAFGRASYTATKLALEGLTEALAHDLAGRVAVNCIRIDMPIWTEGFDATLPADFDRSWFEDAVIMSDAVLWLAKQALDYTGKILTLGDLRARGVVRAPTKAGVRSRDAR
jgi:NAD(P)-dependent dehydrogenase (short-subunit alcohol dehydrogenase family)